MSTQQLQVVHKDLAQQIKNPVIQARFSEVLGKRAPQFISSLIQVGNSLGPDCDSLSIISGAMVAASLDLPINKNLGFAWLVPFREKGVKKAQFQMGYKGYIQLALRTGQYRRMNAGSVNAQCVEGWDAVGERRLDFKQYDPAKPIAGYFFAFEMVNGFVKIAYWSKADVEAHARQYSQSYRGGYDSPWKTHFDEMATKTIIANELRQWGILSVEMQQALSVDQGVVRGMNQEDVVFPDSAPIVEVAPPTDRGPAEAAEAEPQATDSSDDGDLGPQTTQAAEPKSQAAPPKAASAATAEPVKSFPRGAAATPQSELAKMILTAKKADGSEAGLTYDDFKTWAGEVGVLDCSSFSGFDDIPAADAKRMLIVNRNGSVLKGIFEAKGIS